ncbi:hypothetical protein P689_11973 [Candidatus Riesia pediculischaeffi PTSU]|uniref:Uncharacterized protein n=1 Tax=Candidatus Riesia pediculischaeffi PTSU TaxID=1401651 RepID=A0A0C1S0L3_9ENTR|nr:hypothetical protein P689_11973 [Candidatus Riesia pediculischaeffi PTSU]
MVSGFFTSPNDQDRIVSGEARDILIASNSSFRSYDFKKCSSSFMWYKTF